MKERAVPWWLVGMLVGAVLIVLAARTSLGPRHEQLQAQFRPRPGDAGGVALPALRLDQLPPPLRAAQATAGALLNTGSNAPALTPTASNGALRITIDSMQREAAGLRVRGSITNVGNSRRSVATSALQFRDGAGQLYASSGASADLEPGASAAIDLTVPVQAGSSLTMLVDLPPDPPLELALLAA